MGLIGSRTGIAQRPHLVRLQQPVVSGPNTDGGVSQTWVTVDPPAFAQISPATPGLLERIVVGTTSSTATHVVTLPWRPGVTTDMRVLRDAAPSSPLRIVGVLDPDERHIDLVLACAETPDAPVLAGEFAVAAGRGRAGEPMVRG
jgi:head-tail adaptor